MPKKNMWVWNNYIYDYICGNCGYCPNTEQDMSMATVLDNNGNYMIDLTGDNKE